MWGITAKRKRRLSFQYKVAASYVAVIVGILILLNTYPLYVSQNFVFQSKNSGLWARSALISGAMSGLDKLTPESANKALSLLDLKDITRLLVTDETGYVVFDTAADDALRRYALYPELARAMAKNDVFVSKLESDVFYSTAAMPVMSRGNVIGGVVLFETDTEQGELFTRFRSNIQSLSIGISVAVMLISLALSAMLTRRVTGLLRAIRMVRAGEYNTLAPVHGRDELAELAEEFNALTDRIKATEFLRRRFVSDASHELRTPLAAMRLLTDSILINDDISPDEMRDFVSDIGEETFRLQRLTEKLMLLTKIDTKLDASAEIINPAPVIRRAAAMLRPLADVDGVTIKCELAEECAVAGQSDDLYQIVFNLIENGVKYNRPGGEVCVYLYKGEGFVFIQVYDTGIGIPEDDIPRLFERFYRVDKSRKAGGTGLGLSIVRDLVVARGGDISVESEPGKGSRFTVKFREAVL